MVEYTEYLKLNDNGFTGLIPTLWSGLTHLQSLLLQSNSLGGSIPAVSSEMKELQDLRLNNNVSPLGLLFRRPTGWDLKPAISTSEVFRSNPNGAWVIN